MSSYAVYFQVGLTKLKSPRVGVIFCNSKHVLRELSFVIMCHVKQFPVPLSKTASGIQYTHNDVRETI